MPSGKDRHVFQMRQQGRGDDSWYAPDRDVVYMFPELVRSLWEHLDLGAYEQWLTDSGIAPVEIEEAVKVFAKLVSTSHEIPDFEVLLETSGFNKLKWDCQIVILSCLGFEFMRAYHERLFELNVNARVAATQPEKTVRSADKNAE